MAQVSVLQESANVNPLELVEKILDQNEWTSDRHSDAEMVAQAPGQWCDYSLYFAWNEEAGAMHFTCAFDMRVADDRRHLLHELLAIINEKIWLGHFGVWHDEGLPMFRHSMLLRGAGGPSMEQLLDLVETAIEECERFYPAFQYVIWGGKSATEAVAAAMVDTVGEA